MALDPRLATIIIGRIVATGEEVVFLLEAPAHLGLVLAVHAADPRSPAADDADHADLFSESFSTRGYW